MKAERIYTTNEMPDDRLLTVRTRVTILVCLLLAPAIVTTLAYTLPEQFVYKSLLWLGVACWATCSVWLSIKTIKHYVYD